MVGDHFTDTVDKLLYRMLPHSGPEITIEIFARHDLYRQLAPGHRDFDIVLLKYDLPAITADPDRTIFPFELLKGMDTRR
jgi:hypothetical protein